MSFIRFQLPALLFAMLIFYVSSIPDKSLPAFPILSQDKLLHMLEYFIFAMLLHRACVHQVRYPVLANRAMFFSVIAATLYGISDEFHQGFVPGRMVDPFDATANMIGALLFAFVYIKVYSRLRLRRAIGPQ